MSLENRAAAELWLALSENRNAWQRLQQVLELADGFQFLPVHLVNAAAEDLLRPLLTEWCRQEGKHMAGFRLDEPAGDESLLSLILQELQSASRPCIFFFPCGKALYRGMRTPEGQAKLRDFFLFLNQKRDVIAHRADAPLVISLHPQDWKEFRRHAPDFWSIHQAVWRFSGPVAEAQGLPFSLDASLEARETTNEPLELSSPTAPRLASAARPASFIGRQRELEIITATLRSGSGHVVIEGVAGIGKTTLALEAAHQLRSIFHDGVLAFDLAGVVDPASTTPVMSRVIRHFLPRRPISAGGGTRSLYLEATRKGRSLLLILENVDNASVLKELEPGRGCSLLITSRGSLQLPSVYRRVSLSGLGLKEGRRWLERQGLNGEHAAVLIQTVGGHPLTMRLAASLLSQPDGADPRALFMQLRRESDAAAGVLRATVETTVESLGPDQRFLWQRLAVFQGLFGAREAAGISGLEPHLVKGILGSLDQRGLIDIADREELYETHHLLREFAIELLRRAGDETAARDAHARHFLERLRSIASARPESSLRAGLSLGEAFSEMRPLPAELREELTVAQAWILERCKAPDPAGREARELVLEVGLAGAEVLVEAQTPIQRLAWAEILRQTADQRGLSRLAEDAAVLASRARLDRASSQKYFRWVLEVARARGDRTHEAEALGNLGIAQEQAGEIEAATRSYQHASKIFRRLEDLGGESLTLVRLGDALSFAGRTGQAIEAYERAHQLMLRLSDAAGCGRVVSKIGDARARAGDFSGAIPLYQQAIFIFRDHQEIQAEGAVQSQLAHALMSLERFAEAVETFRRASELLREAGDLTGTGNALLGLGHSLIEAGDPRSAILSFEESKILAEARGDSAMLASSLELWGIARARMGLFEEAIDSFEQALQIAREIGPPRREAVVLGNLGNAYEALGDPAKAIVLLEQALEIGKEINAPEIASSVEEALGPLRETAERSDPDRRRG